MDTSVIGFDADDTLWLCEPYFRQAEREFTALFREYGTHDEIVERFFRQMIGGLPEWGYGAKSVILAMLRTAVELAGERLDGARTARIMAIGDKLKRRPVELLPGVKEVLTALRPHFRLWLVTKGDLLDQQLKLAASGLGGYFEHVEVLSEKHPDSYRTMLAGRRLEPANFLMVGNSLRSDILPVLELGGRGIYIPSPHTWSHDHVEGQTGVETIEKIRDLPEFLLG